MQNTLCKFKITDILHEANPVLSQNTYSLKIRVNNIKPIQILPRCVTFYLKHFSLKEICMVPKTEI